GNAVLMPTEFDEFSEKAHSDYMDIPKEAKKHRKILRDAMEKQEFTGIDTEWWHFDYKGYEGKPNLDISIDDL
ncbi:MAG: peptidase M15, partial [Candidatus Marinimicrobia bacterium]|nr:peptidase M15 [Candidatus Neomarinimicrobiota bacterium]